jgi:hypothetical protein
VKTRLEQARGYFKVLKNQFNNSVLKSNAMNKKLRDEFLSCEPSPCPSSCIPGIRISICQDEHFVNNVEQECEMVKVKYTSFVYRVKQEVRELTAYKYEKTYVTDCSKGMFGRRRRSVMDSTIDRIEAVDKAIGNITHVMGIVNEARLLKETVNNLKSLGNVIEKLKKLNMKYGNISVNSLVKNIEKVDSLLTKNKIIDKIISQIDILDAGIGEVREVQDAFRILKWIYVFKERWLEIYWHFF